MRKLLVVAAVFLLPLAACGDDGPVGPERVGSLSFTYSGDIDGTFAVSGAKGREGENFPKNPFAAASRDRAGGIVHIDGVRPTQRPKLDFAAITLIGVSGPKTIAVCANAAVAPDCPSIRFTLGENVTNSQFDHSYVFVSGSVIISEITPERVRGSFHGTAARLEAMGQVNLSRTVAVTNGHFDVPIVRDF